MNMMSADDFTAKQKILIVGPASPSTGGISSYINELLSSQLRDHFSFKVLDSLIVKNRYKKQESQLNFREIKAGLRVLRAFIAVMKDFDSLLVHIHTSSYWGFYEKAVFLIIAKYFFKKKTILHVHGGGFEQFYNASINKGLIRWIIKQSDKTLIVSKSIKGKLNLTSAEHVDNCIQFTDVLFLGDKGQSRKKYEIAQDKTIFLSVSLLQKIKGLHEILKVFSEIHKKRNDFYFIIAGEGPEKNGLLEYIKDNNLSHNAIILNFIAGKTKDDIFHLADCYISNSTVESFGISLVEAISHGLFVITTPVGIASNAENVFNEKNCIRVNIGDHQSLENAIVNVLDKNVDIESTLERNFCDFKARFDSKPVFEKMRLIYKEVLNSN